MKVMGCIVSLGLLMTGGCASSDAGPKGAAPEKNKTAKKSASGYYAEETQNGRIYVLGTEKAHQALTESKQTPHIAKTYIGAGPGGLTVVFEADAKSGDLQERLKSQYEARHGVKLQ
jgi:hypothetical protein